MPLPIYTPCMNIDNGSIDDYIDLLSKYFKQGYNNHEILEFLKLHGVIASLSTLKRRLKSLGLPRRIAISDNELRKAIEEKHGKSGCFVGYRKMWAET